MSFDVEVADFGISGDGVSISASFTTGAAIELYLLLCLFSSKLPVLLRAKGMLHDPKLRRLPTTRGFTMAFISLVC
jgi:hypothetical protein